LLLQLLCSGLAVFQSTEGYSGGARSSSLRLPGRPDRNRTAERTSSYISPAVRRHQPPLA
jgi:hypothetical protein